MNQTVALPYPYHPPLRLLATVRDEPFLVFFDGMADASDLSAAEASRQRYSYLCVKPRHVLEIKTALFGQDPLDELRAALGPLRPTLPDLPPFQGGAAGMLGYELGGCYERVPTRSPDHPWPVLLVGIFDAVLAWDHWQQRSWVIGTPEAVVALVHRLPIVPPALPSPSQLITSARPDQSSASFANRIRQCVDAIHAGDLFQANLSQRFTAPRPGHLSAFDLYRRLRGRTRAPFGGMLQHGALALLSGSPERFLSVDAQGHVETRPIKGTRARSSDPLKDAALAEALRRSDKDHAENLMIVDLLRNDLARSCQVGSVHVPALCQLESFATVHHLVSEVRGQLRPELHAVDLLRAAFPGGSITGAPKVKAMEVIAQLEPTQRGPYCGSLVWIGYDGAMDSNILIRTFLMESNRITLQTGGGITALSDPDSEVEESLIKAAALRRALETPLPSSSIE